MQGASGTNSSTTNNPIKPQSPRRVQCRTLSASPHSCSINTPKQKEEAVMRELQGEQWWGKGRTQRLSDTWKWAELLLFLLLLSFARVRVGRSTSLCVFDVCVCVRACVRTRRWVPIQPSLFKSSMTGCHISVSTQEVECMIYLETTALRLSLKMAVMFALMRHCLGSVFSNA